MKKFTFQLAFMLLATMTVKATQWTVSNDPNVPAQYSNLQTAVDNAAAGDTLLISGTDTDYGTVDITFQLSLIGSGAVFSSSSVKETTKISIINLKETTANSSASNSKIIGIQSTQINFYSGFSGSTIHTGGIYGVLIEKCKVVEINFKTYGQYDGYWGTYQFTNRDDTIRNCIISGHINLNSGVYGSSQRKYKNILILNNIFIESNGYSSDITASGGNNHLDSVYVRNNLFIQNTNSVFSGVPYMVIENNIFYGAEPSTNNSIVTFNNNLCYNTSANMPGTGNTGTGNINNSNPKFVNFPAQGGAFTCGYDFSLQTNSPAKNAGTEGTDIGITGGMFPFYAYCSGPKVPTMKYITMPANANAAPLGGTLNVTFKAKKQD
jgi:hypothetical protein